MPQDSVFRSLKMVVAKSGAHRDPTKYFRAARFWPSLVTALALGYYAVRLGAFVGKGRVWVTLLLMRTAVV